MLRNGTGRATIERKNSTAACRGAFGVLALQEEEGFVVGAVLEVVAESWG